MDWLVPALFFALAGSLILVFTYLHLYLQERRTYLALWLTSWSLYAVRSVFEILIVLWGNQRTLMAMNEMSVVWSAVFLLWGTFLFSGRKMNRFWLALFGGGSLWIITGIWLHFPSLWTVAPAFLLSAFASVLTGIALLRFTETIGPAKLMTGWVFVLWGLHKADYPLLRPFPWTAPFGYVLGAVFGFVSAVGIILMYLERTRKELRESEERYRSIFENAAEGIFQTTPEGRFLRANPALAGMLGYGSADQVVKSVMDLASQVYVDPDDRDRARALVREHGFVKNFETRIRRRDGGTRWVSMNVRAVKDTGGEICFYEGSLKDISDQRRAEGDLRTSRLQLSEAADLARIAYWEHDEASGDFVFNDGFYTLYATTAAQEGGYRMAREEYLRRFVHPDDLEELDRKIRENRAHPRVDGIEIYEHRAIRRDGEVIYILARNRIITGGEGRVVRAIGVNQDITERKKTEARLVESEERYRFLFDSISDAIFVHPLTEEGLPGRFAEVNHAATALLGYSREELLQMTAADISTPEGRESMASVMNRLQRDGWTVREGVYMSKDGRRIPVEVSLHFFDFRGRPTVLAAVRDITRRKAAEEALRATAAHLMRAEEVSKTGNWEIDLTTGMIKGSPGASRIYGLDSAEWPLTVAQQIVLPEYREVLDHALRALISEDAPYDAEFRIRRADDGALIDIHSVAKYDPEQKTIFGVIQDITDRKKLEDQLRQAQKMEAIGTLAGGVAHDFNNILTVIMGFGNLIQMSVGPDDRLKPYVDQIVVSSERAADLTQALLAFSRKQKIAVGPHHVGGVVASTAKLLKRLLTEDIELKLDLADDNALVPLDVTQMDQVLMNLATNARDAMPQGGTITIGTRVSQIDETFRKTHGFGKPGDYVRLSVSDTGIGMDEKMMARIFDPFFTTKEVGKGTGLGLASVYGIVKQHEGYITVSSEPHKGATFDIYLPLARETVQSPPHVGTDVKGGSETILVLEDDPGVRRMITTILSGHGYVTLEASNGDDAIRVFNENRDAIGLIILDVVMPGRNGKEVFDEIARVDHRVKAIFVSGYTGDVVIDKGVHQESVDFLQKPLSVATLLAKVREVLDR